MDLVRDGAVSSEEFQHTQDRITEVRASLTAAREELNEATAQIDRTTIPSQESLANDPRKEARLAQIISDNLELAKNDSKIAANLMR